VVLARSLITVPTTTVVEVIDVILKCPSSKCTNLPISPDVKPLPSLIPNIMI